MITVRPTSLSSVNSWAFRSDAVEMAPPVLTTAECTPAAARCARSEMTVFMVLLLQWWSVRGWGCGLR